MWAGVNKDKNSYKTVSGEENNNVTYGDRAAIVLPYLTVK